MIVEKQLSHRGNAPCGIPLEANQYMVSVDSQGNREERWAYRTRMEIRHGKADLLVRLKATRRRVHLRALDLNVWHKR
jgi:hypothetical protein